MGRIDELAERYARHIATPWQKTIAGAQRVIFVVYDKELERIVRARKIAFENASHGAGHDWHEIDLTDAFTGWIAAEEYREAYFESPDDLRIKLEAEFSDFIAARVRDTLNRSDVGENSVVAVFGAGNLFGFARLSKILKLVENEIRGRLVVFFPGQYDDNNNYRLLDARDGWNYLAIPITLHGAGGAS